MTIAATFTAKTTDGTGYMFDLADGTTPYGSITVYTDTQSTAQATADLQALIAANPLPT